MLAVIGGTGLNSLEGIDGFERVEELLLTTRYSADPVRVLRYRVRGRELLFLPRHGDGHVLPPHRINYRANVVALQQAGAKEVVAMNAVGGIADNLAPGTLAVPDQLIDYSSGREATLFDADEDEVVHIDFGQPYAERLRQRLLQASRRAAEATGTSNTVVDGGVYGCTQGPRLETNAEIRRLRNDGCTMVGMTGMPEAALAREAGLDYASIALSVNWAAGLSHEPITLEEIYAVVAGASPFLIALLRELLSGD